MLDDVPVGTELTFTGTVYEELPATGQPYCSTVGYDQSVTVIRKGLLPSVEHLKQWHQNEKHTKKIG